MIEKVLILMRGLPGSGKSTQAQILGKDGVVLGTDDFWGEHYDFDVQRLGEAHKWNEDRAIRAMDQGLSPVVIDNMNMKPEHAGNYARAAQLRGYRIEVVEPSSPWAFDLDELARRNQHGVSRELLGQMYDAWHPNLTPEEAINARFSSSPEEKKANIGDQGANRN